MDSKEQRSALPAAVYRGDGPAVVDLLRGVGADDDSLQLAGDGLIAAVMQRVNGAAELARKLVVGVRQRGWEGDDELADQLETQLGSGPAAMLRALPVDLEELAGILEGDPLSVGGRIDITTGEVWPQAAIEYVLETGEEDEDTSDDPERWLAVHGEGSREGYRDMELFIASVEDAGRAERLAVAIKGSGAFRRFKESLPAGPASLSDGTHSPRSASAAARDHGSRRPATACCRSTTAIPEDGLPACYQPERGTSSGRAEGRRTHAPGVRPRVSFIAFVPSGIAGPASAKATVRVLADGDPNVDATFASAGGLLAAAEVADAAPATALRPEGPCCAKVRRCPDCPTAAASGGADPRHSARDRGAHAPSAVAARAVAARFAQMQQPRGDC